MPTYIILCWTVHLIYFIKYESQIYITFKQRNNALTNILRSSDLVHSQCVGVNKQCTYKDIYYLPAKCVLQQRNPNSKMKTINQHGMQCLETKELQLHLHSLSANAAAALHCSSKLKNLSPLHSIGKYRICILLAHT